MLISMFLHHLLMLHRCCSHRHACTPSSLLQHDRSHTQPEYEYIMILEVVVIMAGESHGRDPSFCATTVQEWNYRVVTKN